MQSKPLDLGLLIFRVATCLIILSFHGLHKVQVIFGSDPIQFVDPIHIGPVATIILSAFAEFLCSIFVIIGLKTRWAAAFLVINMIVAAFIQRAGAPMSDIQLDLLFLAGFILILLAGAGKYSVDGLMKQRNTAL